MGKNLIFFYFSKKNLNKFSIFHYDAYLLDKPIFCDNKSDGSSVIVSNNWRKSLKKIEAKPVMLEAK